MAAKNHKTPLQEASDPDTNPKRLHELARDGFLARSVLRNPSVPEELWRKALLDGWPEAWSNPMAPIYCLTWTPRPGDTIAIEKAAQRGMNSWWREPHRYSLEGKALLTARVQEWWNTSEKATDMMSFLGEWAYEYGEASPEHKEVVRILLCCVKTLPNLSNKDLEAIGLLETWIQGKYDGREDAKTMKTSEPVHFACQFAWNHQYGPYASIQKAVDISVGYDPGKSGLEQEIRLADLIRQEMPIPAMLPARVENPDDVDQPADIFEAIAWANDGYLSPQEVAELRQKIQASRRVTLLGKPLNNVFLIDRHVVTMEDDDGDISVQSPSEWVTEQMGWGLGKHIKEEVEDFLTERFNEEFQAYPSTLWHATDKKNIPSILKKGLQAANRTRGITNRGVGAAIFTSDNLESLTSGVYGDVILAIDCKAMKRDGLEFFVAQEPSVVEQEVASLLAATVGAEDFEWEAMSDGADDPSTVILHIDLVPPKYLRIVDD